MMMMPTLPTREHITGLVLAGGLGRRMGGVDKGLQAWRGQPLVQHVLARLAPQVGPLLINANRHLHDYAAFGHPVVVDAAAGGDGAGVGAISGSDGLPFAGPLAGMLAGLGTCTTPWLMCVPCDAPLLADDLVMRLCAAFAGQAGTRAAVVISREADGSLQPQPVFCLLHVGLRASLQAWIATGQSKVMLWLRQQGCAQVVCDGGPAFFNTNTLDDLDRLNAVACASIPDSPRPNRATRP